MGLGLLLIPSLGGYWFLQHANITRYEIYRASGYHLLFRSAMVGVILAAIAHALAVFLNHCIPQIREFWYPLVPINYVDTAALSIALAVALPPVINMFYGQERAAKRTAEKYGDLIELVIVDSIERQKMVELSLKNGKSYIGYAIQSNITKRGSSDVALAPVASGYRSEDTRELHITTHYAPVIRKWLGDDSSSIDEIIRDFKVVIPRIEICSARIFDPEVYLLFRQNRSGP